MHRCFYERNLPSEHARAAARSSCGEQGLPQPLLDRQFCDEFRPSVVPLGLTCAQNYEELASLPCTSQQYASSLAGNTARNPPHAQGPMQNCRVCTEYNITGGVSCVLVGQNLFPAALPSVIHGGPARCHITAHRISAWFTHHETRYRRAVSLTSMRTLTQLPHI